MCEVSELLAALGEFLRGARSLLLEDLADAHERHVEGRLRHRERAPSGAVRDLDLRGGHPQHVADRVAPAQAALDHLIERGGTVGGELPEELEGFFRGLQAVLGLAPRHPLGDRDRGDPADSLQALLYGGVQLTLRLGGARDEPRDHPVRACVQQLAEPANLLICLGLPWRGCGHGSHTLHAVS